MEFYETGTFVGRVWRPELEGPSVVVIRNGDVVDITSPEIPTVRDLIEMKDPAGALAAATGETIGRVADFLGGRGPNGAHLLAPIDLQAVKACGVTFARSMLERVIEE
ncbi:MAG: fumarylacetoacetate hydrolase, partial [Hyphomicrobiales bacterium]